MNQFFATSRRVPGWGVTALTLLIALGVSRSAVADIRLPAIFGDHMVLQRDSTVAIWGWSDAGAPVTFSASWLDHALRTRADGEGRWRLEVPTASDAGPHEVRVTAGASAVTIRDVLLGEVWLCSGQSNMEWPVLRSDDAEREIAAADHPNIRLFMVRNDFAYGPRDDCVGTWSACTPESVSRFSAVGYYFALAVQAEIDAPIGLISSDWGGTPAEAWTSIEALRAHGGFDKTLRDLAVADTDPDALEATYAKRMAEWWKVVDDGDAGIHSAWSTPEFDDGDWSTTDVPATWSGDLASFDGIVWMRREIDVPPDWVGRDLTLRLGAIDDMDVTYFNGTRVGGMTKPGAWQTPRVYTVPAELVRRGRNLIAVRVLDTGGHGGITGSKGSITLARADVERSARSLEGAWRYQVGRAGGTLPPQPSLSPFNQRSPSVLYNGMIAPIVPYGIAGAIWYQGESNRTRARQYRTLFPAMIQDWRSRWDDPFPFYFVQIAPFAYGGDTGQAAELREAQEQALRLEHTGMVVTMDIGNPRDIHPTNKQEVGRRLALCALSDHYDKPRVHSGPTFRSMRVEDSSIRIAFDHADGLGTSGGALTDFEIAGADGVFAAADARVDGQTVVVSRSGVTAPVHVRYAWSAAPSPNLVNGAGLPAVPFRSNRPE